LGFVVDRYLRVKNFVSEPFWGIRVVDKRGDQNQKKSGVDGPAISVVFNWARGHLFDRMAVVVLYERCLNAKTAKVTKMQKRPTSKWKPLPLTTVELQKMGSRYLRMNSHQVMKVRACSRVPCSHVADKMKIAEDLYTKGWISYPRTETDQFDRGMDLRALVQKQTQGSNWGEYAQGHVLK
jgi:DNA topoisomerase-3